MLLELSPASSTILADKPLCASIKNSNSFDCNIFFNCVVFLKDKNKLVEELELVGNF